MMDLDALARVFAPPRAAPEKPPAEAAERPQEAPALAPPWDDMTDPAGRLEAREERAAILEHEAGLRPEAAKAEAARLHPDPQALGAVWYGFAPGDLRDAAGEDWPEIEDRPAALDALALLLEAKGRRDRGELPAHYTTQSLCAICGPVYLWAGAPARVLACPFCLAPGRADFPRPADVPAADGDPTREDPSCCK